MNKISALLRALLCLFSVFSTASLFAQSGATGLRGIFHTPGGEPVPFANLALFSSADSSLSKVGMSNETGEFLLIGITPGSYYLKATYLGYAPLHIAGLELQAGKTLEMGVLNMEAATLALAEATVTASRALLEQRSDRTIFNVDGTINSTGGDALSLLRKAPNVSVDNNNNINVLGRSGVLLYIDGKRLPLVGEELAAYLEGLPADQIDRFEIITNPGARYEAEGNAGIIDIRLKKDKGQGANGSVTVTASEGVYPRANVSGSGNYRKNRLNVFGTAGVGLHKGFNDMFFNSELNNSVQDETNLGRNNRRNYNFRAGADFYLDKKNTLGVLAGGNYSTNHNRGYNRIALSSSATPEVIESILVADNIADQSRAQSTINLNYRFDNAKGRVFNVDLDYGNYHNTNNRYQPNRYYDATETTITEEAIYDFNTPTDIDIYTAQADYEAGLWGGKWSAGSKFSRVVSDNTFFQYEEENNIPYFDEVHSNIFDYDETVIAGYLGYSKTFSPKWEISAGLRAEHTDAVGVLTAFRPDLQKPPVKLRYLSWFPNLGISWQAAPQHAFSFNTGRRINRPDYNVLNPFRNQLSELSYEKGNPELQPEIVNNIELGYTLANRYNLKIGYSLTTDQITRLIAPDKENPLAGFITWANLATQSLFSVNLSAPVQITKRWNAYFNAGGSYLDNQADYGENGIVDIQAFTYNIFQQHNFDLPGGFNFEVSGWFSGPGVWGGVFLYETSWSLDIGLQKKFFNNRLNVKLSANDLFYQSGWDGYSDFDGLYSYGSGRWDSRRVGLSIGYRFGNDNVKSRRRSTSIEAEAGRVTE